jgi:hypothetical protein
MRPKTELAIVSLWISVRWMIAPSTRSTRTSVCSSKGAGGAGVATRAEEVCSCRGVFGSRGICVFEFRGICV